MIWLFLTLALLCAAHMSTPAQEPPSEEIRIGDVAEVEVEEIDEVKDVRAANGWYKKTKGGWMFWPEGTTDESRPPKKELTAFMDGQLMESVLGLLILAVPLVLLILVRRRKKKRADGSPNGVSQIQYQALMRQLTGMARILENVVPDEDGRGAKVTERRKRR